MEDFLIIMDDELWDIVLDVDLPKLWAIKVDAITEANYPKVLLMDALTGNLQTHEMNMNQDNLKKELKKYKSLDLNSSSGEILIEVEDKSYFTKIFQKSWENMEVFKREGLLPGMQMLVTCVRSVERLDTSWETA